jgi:hypothetical protein
MFLGDNVLNMVRQFGVLLRQQAVLTTILGPLPNEIGRGRIHG